MYTPLILLSFASIPLLAQGKRINSFRQLRCLKRLISGGCPDSFSRGGKKVFCYYEGKKSPQSIDPCPCTHLLYKNVIIDPDSQLRLSSQIRDDLHRLRSSKPSLAVLLSIGGDAVESDTFRAIVSRSVLLENSLDPSPRYPGYNSPDSFYQERRRVSTGF